MNILHLDSSARIIGSDSRALGAHMVNRYKAEKDANIIYRDVNVGLHLLTPQHLGAYFTNPEKRTDSQNALTKISDSIVEELKLSDCIVTTLPMYNNNIPAALKMWQDLAMREGLTFKSTPNGTRGMLENKRAITLITTGGMPQDSNDNLLEQLMCLFLNAMGISDQTFVHAGNLAYDKQASLQNAFKEIDELSL